MQTAVAIGKYTLESLTTGMYASPKDLFREYIQNSVDSIDQAVQSSVLKHGEGKIVISVSNNNRCIEIEDNGFGIPCDQAVKILTDIGNSSKIYTNNRGFRGIGRLAGLSYCDKLTFISSYAGEIHKVEVVFDCLKLKELLIPGQYSDYDLSKVLSEVTSHKTYQESSKKHYFKVILEGVEDMDGVLNIDEVKDYISQVAPLPYDPVYFKWGKELKDKLTIKGYEIGEYNIFIMSDNTEEQLYKMCADSYTTDKVKRITDKINKLKIHEIKNSDGQIQAYFWYGISNFYGTILDESMKGIRLRKGNILVGDKSTLNKIFKEDRFNGWFQGEVFVLDPNIIPNARRDDFEKNSAYVNLLKELNQIGDDLSKTIRSVSSSRNDKSGKVLNDAEQLINKADKLLQQGFNSQKEKELLTKELNKFTNDLENAQLKDEFNINRKLDIFKQLGILANIIKGATNFKILNLSQKLSNDQKKTLEKVFEVLTENCEKKEADRLIGEIMKRF